MTIAMNLQRCQLQKFDNSKSSSKQHKGNLTFIWNESCKGESISPWQFEWNKSFSTKIIFISQRLRSIQCVQWRSNDAPIFWPLLNIEVLRTGDCLSDYFTFAAQSLPTLTFSRIWKPERITGVLIRRTRWMRKKFIELFIKFRNFEYAHLHHLGEIILSS